MQATCCYWTTSTTCVKKKKERKKRKSGSSTKGNKKKVGSLSGSGAYISKAEATLVASSNRRFRERERYEQQKIFSRVQTPRRASPPHRKEEDDQLARSDLSHGEGDRSPARPPRPPPPLLLRPIAPLRESIPLPLSRNSLCNLHLSLSLTGLNSIRLLVDWFRRRRAPPGTAPPTRGLPPTGTTSSSSRKLLHP